MDIVQTGAVIKIKGAQKMTTFSIFNPHNKPIEELPFIYGFNNGGDSGFFEGVLIAQDGTQLGSHICSSESYMLGDLGILDGTRPDRHETFKKHYPDGYRMDFIAYDKVQGHAELMLALEILKNNSLKTHNNDDDDFDRNFLAACENANLSCVIIKK